MRRASLVTAAAVSLVGGGCGSRPHTQVAEPAKAPTCTAAVLRPARSMAATGHVFQPATPGAVGVVLLVNIGTRPCVIEGWPTVRLVRPGEKVDDQRFRRSRGSRWDPLAKVRRILLRTHQKVQFTIAFGNWCGPGSNAAGGLGGRSPTRMLITLPNGGGELAVDFYPVSPACGDSSQPADVFANPFIRTPTNVAG